MHGPVADESDRLGAILGAAASQHEEACSRGETELPEFTENAVARRFARQAAGTLAYNHSAPGWLVWNGAVWSADNVSGVVEQIRRFVETARKSALAMREVAAMARVRFISAVEQISRSDPVLAVHEGMLDTDPVPQTV
jgi:putative DNA primase/helicase